MKKHLIVFGIVIFFSFIIVVIYEINDPTDWSFKSLFLSYERNLSNFSVVYNETTNSSLSQLLYDNVTILMRTQLQLNQNLTTIPPYGDPTILKGCSVRQAIRQELFTLFKYWQAFAVKHNIIWWISDGTLIGALRHNDKIPWDHDADISVLTEYEPLLRRLQVKRGNMDFTKPKFVCRPSDYCLYNGPRMNCNGNNVTRMVDGCAFCGPLARIMLSSSWLFIDIFRARVELHDKSLNVFMESHYFVKDKRPIYPIDWIFPLTTCTFMGLKLPCPARGKDQLIKQYGSVTLNKKCKNGTWH